MRAAPLEIAGPLLYPHPRAAAEQVRKRAERLLRQEVGPDVDVEEEVRKLGGIGGR